MRKINRIKGYAMCLISLALLFSPEKVKAQEENVYIADDADILTQEEETELRTYLESLSKDYNYVAVTSDYNEFGDAHELADDYYCSQYGMQDDGVAFLVDMDYREIYISGHGKAKKILADGDCLDITDNVYKYASRGEYLNCIVKAFEQASRLLSSGFILRPMRYLVAALISVVLGFLITFFWAMRECGSISDIVSDRTVATFMAGAAIAGTAVVYDTKKVKHESSSGGSGGGGGWDSGGGGGFSGGGGGSSGGGHSF